MQKFSRQRQAIKDYMITRRDHPTAEMVYHAIQQTLPNISLGTVYRNLSLLSANGELARLVCGDGIDHFDPNTEAHYHFVCERCGCVEDLPLDVMHSIDDLASHFCDGEITHHSILFYGTCSSCKTEKNA